MILAQLAYRIIPANLFNKNGSIAEFFWYYTKYNSKTTEQGSLRTVANSSYDMHVTQLDGRLGLTFMQMLVQSTLHNSDRFYPDFCIFRTELLSPISFLLKCNTEKVST